MDKIQRKGRVKQKIHSEKLRQKEVDIIKS